LSTRDRRTRNDNDELVMICSKLKSCVSLSLLL